jgi:secreted PhoX family phosphatase
MAAALPGLGALGGLPALACRGRDVQTGSVAGGYGPLARTTAENAGTVLLELPRGFRYTAFGRTGDPLSDGRDTPPWHDGMAAFQVGAEVRLVRNHERRNPVGPGQALSPAGPSYDPHAPGGTTTLVVDPVTRELRRSFVSLSGTSTNCAGGPTPWGTWISCEETTAGPASGYREAHGYCFEVSAAADRPVTPVPLRAMGRFVHEAVAIDPTTGIVYLTEDAREAGWYRFLPHRPRDLAAGGRLQMLAIRDRPGHDLRRGQTALAELPVSWVDIADPDPAGAETDPAAVRLQGAALGGATFARLEGAWAGDGRIFVNATAGGDAGLGQVWEYRPAPDGGALRLLFESPSRQVLGSPDNLCVSPRGQGLILCEDGEGVQRLHGLTRAGTIFPFARNAIPGAETMEFAGATFSPDGETLFVNVQTPGVTFAIWGDWSRGAL